MGANGLKSIRYSGDGIGYTFGQAYKPGLAVAEDHRAFLRAHGQLRHRLDARRDRVRARGGTGRRRLSACGAATERAVRERRLCVESGGECARAGTALRHRSRPSVVDHAAGRHQGGDQEQCHGPPGNARRQDVCRRFVHRARPVQGGRVHRRQRPRRARRIAVFGSRSGRHPGRHHLCRLPRLRRRQVPRQDHPDARRVSGARPHGAGGAAQRRGRHSHCPMR